MGTKLTDIEQKIYDANPGVKPNPELTLAAVEDNKKSIKAASKHALRARAEMFKKAAELVAGETLGIDQKRRFEYREHEAVIEKLFDKFNENPSKEAIEFLVHDLQAVLGAMGLEDPKTSLADAEFLLNWRDVEKGKAAREPQAHLQKVGEGEDAIYILQGDRPQAKPAQEQLLEMQKIFGSEEGQPKWFKALPQWEQEYFKSNFVFLKGRDLNNETVLKKAQGEYQEKWGNPPTTLRKYPFLANYSEMETKVYDKAGNPKGTIVSKTRSGNIVPFGVKDKKERLELTKQNIRQIIQNEIAGKIASGQYVTNANGEIELPVLIQTLVKPVSTMLEKLSSSDPESPMLKMKQEAIRQLEAEYQKAGGIKIGGKTVKITFVDSNYSINRNLQKIQMANATRNIKAMDTVVALARAKDKNDNLQVRRDAQNLPERRLFERALINYAQNAERYKRRYKGLGKAMAVIPYASGLRVDKNTFFLETAALEQILMCRMGIATGGCKSGKDRKGMEVMFTQAMEIFFVQNNRFPDFGDKKDRKAFAEIFKSLFHSRFQEQLAASNAKGAEGLQAVDGVLPKWLQEEVGIDVLKASMKRGKLNKIKKAKEGDLKSDMSLETMSGILNKLIKSVAPEVVSPAAPVVSAVVEPVPVVSVEPAAKQSGDLLKEFKFFQKALDELKLSTSGDKTIAHAAALAKEHTKEPQKPHIASAATTAKQQIAEEVRGEQPKPPSRPRAGSVK